MSFLDFLNDDAGAEQQTELNRRIGDFLSGDESIHTTDQGEELQNIQPTLIQTEPEQLDSGKFKCSACECKEGL